MPDTNPGHKMKIRCPSCGVKLDVSELEPFSQVSCPKCDMRITIPKWFNDNILLEERFFDSQQRSLYRSLEPSLDREATVKLVKESACSAEVREAFLEAVRKQATISHPSIASIYGCGSTAEGAYVVSQYMPSVEWPCEEFREVKTLLELAGEMVGAVAEAAAAGIHHGNLCPANILISQEHDVLVTDFGAAVALGTKPGLFAAPERKVGEAATLEEDVYSLGACIYYMATGVIPEHGGAKPIGELRKGLPFNVVEAIMKMLSVEPSKRPTNLTELATVFRGNSAAAKGNTKKRLKRSGAVHVKVERQQKKGSLLNVALTLACLLALGIGGVYAFKMKSGEKSGAGNGTFAAENQGKAGLGAANNAQATALPAECLAARPRPDDLDFKVLKEKNQEYLKLVPEKMREVERDRLRLIGGSLDYLKACMKAGAYNRAEDYPIRLKDGTVIKGIIPYAPNNENLVTIRRSGNLDAVKVPFSKLDFMQVIDMFQFYAEKREEMALGKMNRLIKNEIYSIYLQAALLCDWYEKPEEAKKYAALALQYRPRNEEEIVKFGLPVPDEVNTKH